MKRYCAVCMRDAGKLNTLDSSGREAFHDKLKAARKANEVLNKALEEGANVRLSQHARIMNFNEAMQKIIEIGEADTEDSQEVQIAKEALGYRP